MDTLDSLISIMRRDEEYCFLMDGQMAAVDDYLEIRPEAAGALKELCSTGRLSLGPWYVLCDEMLISPETIVRNLETGIERARSFGRPMMIGYLPDMFGHVAQMPQILRSAGMADAVVWRGVPSAVDRTAFWWSSPDGSTVRAEYLVHGYGNGAHLPDDVTKLVERVRSYEREVAPFLIDALLLMNGADHLAPQAGLTRAVAEANRAQSSYELRITSLEEVLRAAPGEGLPRWTGELRSGARAHLLMGVASNRVDVRQAAARTERAIEQIAEPLCALFLPPELWPSRLLEIAWRNVLHNAAHDSICACSADEVVEAVTCRYAEARHIAEGLSARALGSLAQSLGDNGPLVVNTAARTRSGVVEIVIAGEDELEGTQVITAPSSLPGELTLDTRAARRVLESIHDTAISDDAFVQDVRVSVTEPDGGQGTSPRIEATVTVAAERSAEGATALAEAKQQMYTWIGALPDAIVHVRIHHQPARRLAAYVEGVPGFGWRTWRPRPLSNPVTLEIAGGRASGRAPRSSEEPAAVPEPAWPVLDNGLVRVVVDASDGTFAVNGHAGLGRLVDGGDEGDTYNYSPPTSDATVSLPSSVEIAAVESGPVRAAVEVRANYDWPERIDLPSSSRVGAVQVSVTTRIELRANEKLVRVTTSFVNPCRDHRLRAHFPLPGRATCSVAESAFAVVTRGLEAEGGESERGLPTFCSRRFVSAGGLTVFHEGLLEYELIDLSTDAPAGGAHRAVSTTGSAGTLAITLLRCTGALSRTTTAYRLLPAGPPLDLEGPQMQGPVQVTYALCVGELDTAAMYALADDALLPLITAAPSQGRAPEAVASSAGPGDGSGDRPRRGGADPCSALEISGAQVSALLRRNGRLVTRVFNPSDIRTTVRVPGRTGTIVELSGQAVAIFADAFELGPWKIATVEVDERLH